MYLRLYLPLLITLNSTVTWAACGNGSQVCLEQNYGVDASLAYDESDRDSADRFDIKQLSDDITTDLQSRRLTRPAGNNALEKILVMQRVSPNHDYSVNGERYVARIYLSMARVDVKRNRVTRARERYEAAAGIYPALEGLEQVADSIEALSLQPATPARASENSEVSTASDATLNKQVIDNSSASELTKATMDAKTSVDKDNSVLITPVMVGLPAGSFVMGSEAGIDNEKPAHQVEINAFSMSRFEVTREQYFAYAQDAGIRYSKPELHEALLPVSGLTWHESHSYTQWLSGKTGKRYRLPTEEEWEYAARAGTVTPYHSGDTIFGMANCLTCVDEIPRSAVTVGSFEPNPFGLYDMHGNVAEWVSDCLTSSYFVKVDTRDTGCTKRVVRGGSWRLIRENVRSSYRTGLSASERSMDTGFRVVRDGL